MAKSGKSEVVARDKDGMEIGFSHELRDHGPLPSPEDVERYDAVIPDFGDRVMKMAEQRQEGDIRYRDEASRQNHGQTTLGQICIVVISVCGYGTAVAALMLDYPWVCGAISSIVTVCVTALVVVSRRGVSGGEKKREIITEHD